MALDIPQIPLKISHLSRIYSEDGKRQYITNHEPTFKFPVGTVLTPLSGQPEYYLFAENMESAKIVRGPYSIELPAKTKLLELNLDAEVTLNKNSKFLLAEKSIVIIPKGTMMLKNGVVITFKYDDPMYLSCQDKSNIVFATPSSK